MTDEQYNRYVQLINRKYHNNYHNQRRHGLVLKLMSWQYQQYNNRPYHEEVGL